MPKKMPLTFGIIGGHGVMGQVFSSALKKNHTVLIHDPAVPSTSLATLLQQSDIVIVAVPLHLTPSILADLALRLRKNQLLIDLASIKQPAVAAARATPSEFVSLHPMFGSVKDTAGLSCFVYPIRAGTLWKKFRHLLTSDLGLHLTTLTPSQHDQRMALHQSLHHLLTLSFAGLLTDKKIDIAQFYAETTPSMRLPLLTAGRILSQQLELYRDIEFLNPETKKISAEIAAAVTTLSDIVIRRDTPAFDALWKKSAKHFKSFSPFAFQKSSALFIHASEKKRAQPATSGTHAILGPATQCEIAARLMTAGTPYTPLFRPTIAGVFDAVLNKKAPYGIVPLENFSIGPVRETLRALHAARGTLSISDSFDLTIHHALIGRVPRGTRPTALYAHPQAFAQCAAYITRHLSDIPQYEVRSAGEGILASLATPGVLAIGPADISREMSAPIYREHIEDSHHSQTRFIRISRTKNPGTVGAALFSFPVDKPGNLAHALATLSQHHLNLTRIESIPDHDSSHHYFFFIEFTGYPFTPAFASLKKTANVTLLRATLPA